MTFVPGLRRKKQAKLRRETADRNIKLLDEQEWLDDSSESDGSLTHSNNVGSSCVLKPDDGDNERKRKRQQAADEHARDDSPSSCDTADKSKCELSISMSNLLYLREVGAVGNRAYRHATTPGKLITYRSWRSLLLCKPSPPPSSHNNIDSTTDDSDSRWIDHFPPIYNIPYYHNNIDPTSFLRKQIWRKKQIIPFSKLKTPLMDVILGVDSSGGYLIGIGGIEHVKRRHLASGSCLPKLLLKFYGVPSPHRLDFQPNSAERQPVSPFMFTIPLLLETDGSNQDRNMFDDDPYLSPAAEHPLQILLSDDCAIGVAFVRHASEHCAWSKSLQDEEVLGTIIIFERFYNGSGLVRTYRRCNVRIGGWNSYTMRNSLWKTSFIPTGDFGTTRSRFKKALSAYILFNDEDDGFRITWIAPFGTMPQLVEYRFKPRTIQSSRRDILTILSMPEEEWEMNITDSVTGQVYQPPTKVDGSDLEVSFELYLNVDALLSDILDRRKKSSMFRQSPYQSSSVRFIPEFCYNLVSVDSDDMHVTLVLVFSNREKMMINARKKNAMPSVIGVVVRLSLCDQSYDELEWVYHNDSRSMKQWCKSLALNMRMRESRVGIFCTRSSSTIPNWLCDVHEHNSDEDLEDDRNVALWTQYAKKRNNAAKKNLVMDPKSISMSSLFPYCDVVSNRAVQTAVPLSRMTSRCSPVEVVYG